MYGMEARGGGGGSKGRLGNDHMEAEGGDRRINGAGPMRKRGSVLIDYAQLLALYNFSYLIEV